MCIIYSHSIARFPASSQTSVGAMPNNYSEPIGRSALLRRDHFGFLAATPDNDYQQHRRLDWVGTNPPAGAALPRSVPVGAAACGYCHRISWRWLTTHRCPFCGSLGCDHELDDDGNMGIVIHEEDNHRTTRQRRLDDYRLGQGRSSRPVLEPGAQPIGPTVATPADTRRLYRGDLEPYGHTTAVKFFGTGPMYIGSEVELHGDWRAAYQPASNPILAAAKQDGTLCRGGGELVTHPIDLDFWHRKGERYMSRFFASLDPSATRCGRREPCAGLHFHISSAPLGARGIWGLLYLHGAIGRKLGELGGRGTGSHWGGFGNLLSPTMRNAQAKVRFDKNLDYIRAERYSAVNLTRQGTVELRYMAGATDFATYAYRFELAHALGSMATDASAMRRIVGQERKAVAFASYIRQNEQRYPHLKAEIDRRNWRGVA